MSLHLECLCLTQVMHLTYSWKLSFPKNLGTKSVVRRELSCVLGSSYLATTSYL